jgi:glucans biosynthesis protein C
MKTERRYDIDWLRVIAIGLLMVYHVAIVFQPWGLMVGFITNAEAWESLWIPMTLLNVWRIPLLFFISGMGVYFSFQNRNGRQLLKERTVRIFIPYLFGIFVIVPAYVFILQNNYKWTLAYSPSPSHLWFLGNIYSYALLTLPIFYYYKSTPSVFFSQWLKKIGGSPLLLLIVMACFIAEVALVKPVLFEMYAMTWHGYFLGLLAFIFGFCFVLLGTPFWNMLVRFRWLFLILSGFLFGIRTIQTPFLDKNIHLPLESCLWIFAIFAFGHKHLNRNNKVLAYLNKAVYPIYILHMIFIGLWSWVILPLNIGVVLKFISLLIAIVGSCLLCYEFILRRIKSLKILFGIN